MELSNGNTYPAVGLPFGMNFLAPNTGNDEDGFQYVYSKHYLYGFRLTHQPSLWIGDYGQISLMPLTDPRSFREEDRKSWFSHKSEQAHPYRYSVYLADIHVHASMTATERAAILRFSFYPGDRRCLLLDAFPGDSAVTLSPDGRTLTGYSTRNSGGVPKNFHSYFFVELSEPATGVSTFHGDVLVPDTRSIHASHAGIVIEFAPGENRAVEARIASSFISEDQARLNLKEVEGKSFEMVEEAARRRWNRELQRVGISGGTDAQRATFYSCLYRMLLYPQKAYELDLEGKPVHYSPYNGDIEPGYLYSNEGFWDTFRAQFPYLELMYPSIVSEIMQGLVNAYHEGGWIPEWSSPGYRDSMIGNHSASIIADSYLKGVRGFDAEELYRGLKKGTDSEGPNPAVGRAGAEYYNKLGYIPSDKLDQSVSRTLEYAYDDYALSRFAAALGHTNDAKLFRQRSENYRNVFDPSTNLMRPRRSDGQFFTPFNPFRWGDQFTEANSWQYTWFVPQDPVGLMRLMGGEDRFFAQLDKLFSLPPVFDISFYHRGIIHLVREMQGIDMGQYAHGNEPVHQVAYLYDYGEPWKTQYWVRDILNRLYAPQPDGYVGDEDTGQMSAWYVFSSLGFYPLAPVSNQYAFGAPLFPRTQIHLPNGRTLTIAANQAGKYRYVRSVSRDDVKTSRNWISFKDLLRGGMLDFEMSSTPSYRRGISPEDWPASLTSYGITDPRGLGDRSTATHNRQSPQTAGHSIGGAASVMPSRSGIHRDKAETP